MVIKMNKRIEQFYKQLENMTTVNPVTKEKLVLRI